MMKLFGVGAGVLVFLIISFNSISCNLFFSSTESDPGEDDGAPPVEEEELSVYVSNGGDNNNPGTRAKPAATIARGIELAVEIGAGTVKIAAGAYHESVETTVSLVGGFDPETWERDVPANETTVSAVDGTAAAITVVGGAAADEILLDGLSVYGLSGAIIEEIQVCLLSPCSAAVLVKSGSARIAAGKLFGGEAPVSAGLVITATVAVENSRVVGGRGEELTLGIIASGSNLDLRDNEIAGGAGALISHGVFLVAGSDAQIVGNQITGGDTIAGTSPLVELYGSSTGSGGIFLYHSSATIEGNQITGGASAEYSGGLILSGNSTVTAIENSIVAGTGEKGTAGVNIFLGDAYLLRNVIEGGTSDVISSGAALLEGTAEFVGNAIFCGASENPRCLIVDDGAEALILNNYIDGGDGTKESHALHIGGTATVVNNIIVDYAAGAEQTVAIYLSEAASVKLVANNVVSSEIERFHVPCLLWDATVSILCVDKVEALNNCDLWPACATSTGNISADPGLSGEGEYHLADGSPCIDAGVDPASISGRRGAGDEEIDLDGDARPQGAAWDIGPDEYRP